MNELMLSSSYLAVVLSLLSFFLGRFIQRKTKSSLANPLVISIVITVAFLVLTKTSFESYNRYASVITWFLTPATVSLAVPLYEQLTLIRKNSKAIALGILSGVVTSLVTCFVLCLLFDFDRTQFVTLLPKNITTAIGMDLSAKMGGIQSVTVVAICIAGNLGAMIAPSLLRLLRITEPEAMGIAVGSASHAIGTSKCMEFSETAGAFSSLSLVISGLLTVVICTFI